MKRYGKLFPQIVDIENIRLAHRLAQRGKQHYTAVKKINKDPDTYLLEIQRMLIDGTFTTSPYKTEWRVDSGKLRLIHKLPYFPDRIVQHAIMNVVAPIWRKRFIRDTFQSIEGRGTHDARKRVEKYLKANPKQHAIKLDIAQYYPSVPNDIMKSTVGATIKCPQTLRLLYNIIDSHTGLPIGNYTSQYLGNLYLTALDWWVKQEAKIIGYFRYCDDIVFLHSDSTYLHTVVVTFTKKLRELKLAAKNAMAYRYVEKQGLDFCGFVFFGTHTKLRKRIANRMRLTRFEKDPEKIMKKLTAYWGWVKCINARALWSTMLCKELLLYTDGVYANNPLRRTL